MHSQDEERRGENLSSPRPGSADDAANAFPVLFVEDNDTDYAFISTMCRKAGIRNQLIRCADGDSALDFLHRRGPYAGEPILPKPGLIFLDLNLPGTDGRDVLREIKQDQALRSIPVLILTTSLNVNDARDCYKNGANSYHVKPGTLGEFNKLIELIRDYWFGKRIVLVG